MKKIIFLCLWVLVTPLSHAQQTTAQSGTGSDVDRARISTERLRLDAAFAAEDTACYQRFWVNNCLNEVKVRRQEMMADLRRQEIALNDRDRKLKGAEQIRKTEEKASPEKQQEAANRRAESVRDFQDRMERAQQKNTDQAAAQSAEGANRQAAEERLKGSQDKAAARVDKQAAAAEESRKYAERQQEAADRKARRDKQRLANTKEPAKSLPLPE